MGKTEWEELEEAYRKEKDPKVVLRVLAVHMVRVREMSIGETAANLMRSERWVHKWLEAFRYRRPGRPPGSSQNRSTSKDFTRDHDANNRAVRPIQVHSQGAAEGDTRGDQAPGCI